MCQPKPGPRCAAHTRFALQRAKTASESAALYVHREPTPENQKAHQEALGALQEAQQAYDCTPQGQKALKGRIARLAQSEQTAQAKTLYSYLQERQAERFAQVQAAKMLAQSKASSSLSDQPNKMLENLKDSVKYSTTEPTTSFGLKVKRTHDFDFDTRKLYTHMNAYGCDQITPKEEILVSKIKYTHQRDVFPVVVMNYVEPGSVQLHPVNPNDPPWLDNSAPLVVRLRDGSYFVIDGNHRVCASKVKKDKKMIAHVIDIDDLPQESAPSQDVRKGIETWEKKWKEQFAA